MVKNQYEGYEYIDPNHQYTYPNSTVLINKQNITNIEEAYRNEHLFVTRRLADLRLKVIEVYSISDILAIHNYLFQDVYAWAGQYRKVNISKNGNPFMIFSFNDFLKRSFKRSGIQKEEDFVLTTHVFRHSHISLLAELEVPIKAIMERVGHTNEKMTLGVYTHVTEQMKFNITEKLDKLDL